MCDESDLCQMFDYLHLLKGFQQGSAITDCAVIGHKDSVMVWDERDETSCHLFGSGCGVCRKWDYPESHHSFLTQHLFQSPADAGEGCRDRRMRMNDRCDVVSMPVDFKMHTDFASHLPVSIELSPLKIDDDHVG
jgi:hypothetical protein